MSSRLVIDIGPLITLAGAELLDLAGALPLDCVCPPEVEQEVLAGADKGTLPGLPAWLTVLPLSQPLDAIAVANLDRGEAAVIQLALEQGIDQVCIDDRKGRRAALATGLKITGTLGLLAAAKLHGLVPAVRPLVRFLPHPEHLDRRQLGLAWYGSPRR